MTQIEKIKMLIVDDEEEFCRIYEQYYQLRDYTVSIAYSAQEAMSIIQKQDPHILILDIKLPGTDGLEMLSRLRQCNKKIKVVMITGFEDDELEKRARQFDIAAFIHKPVLIEELESVIKKASIDIKGGN